MTKDRPYKLYCSDLIYSNVTSFIFDESVPHSSGINMAVAWFNFFLPGFWIDAEDLAGLLSVHRVSV